MNARELPPAWALLLGGGGPAGASAPTAADARRRWEQASGADPAGLRGCARWCDARAGELERLTEAGRTLPERVHHVPGGHPVAEDLQAGLRSLEDHAEALRDAATALRAGAVAVETIRERHEETLSAVARACAPGATPGPEPGGAGDPAGEARGAFDRSCAHSAEAMRRIDEVLSDAIGAGMPRV